MDSFKIQDLLCQNKLTEINDFIINNVVEAYMRWKDLNLVIDRYGGRKINFPSDISEPIICYVLGLVWSNKKEPGDAYTYDGHMVEIKATSNYYEDTTSFSPSHIFDILIFGRLDYDKDILYIYNLNLTSDTIRNVYVSKTQTLGQQQDQGRRPRFSVIDKIINVYGLQPIAAFSFRTGEIVRYNQ